jgi:hypothetical protein
MRRLAVALPLALLTATALPAAKPVPYERPGRNLLDEARERYRDTGISVCVADLRRIGSLEPDDLETICGCALDRFMQGRETAALPRIEPGQFPPAMNAHVIGCTSQVRPERTSDVARRNVAVQRTAPPAVAAPAADAPKPLDDDNVPGDMEGSGDSGGFWDWVGTITLPAWLTGASALWWIAIGIFVFGLLILKVRRRDPRNDLMGPPSAMRRGAPPRRPDLPR